MTPEPQCTCLSISRDPLCVYHGDVDKIRDGAKGCDSAENILGTQTDRAPCAICRQQGNPTPFGHWAWHTVCLNELNPVALIGFIDRLPETTAVTQIREYVIAVTGMDVDAAKAKISEHGW